MAYSQPLAQQSGSTTILAGPSPSIMIPGVIAPKAVTRFQNTHSFETFSPVNQNGSFEFDRVIKAGYVQKRTQKTKNWKAIYLVLRPNTLSIYRSDKEDKLQLKLYLRELTAVTLLRDHKQKRDHVFGLYSPAKNFHFQASNMREAHDWVELLRSEARIEEEEEEMFMTSPISRRQILTDFSSSLEDHATTHYGDRYLSSSPEPHIGKARVSTQPHYTSSSGMSANELASHSDFSDNDIRRLQDISITNLGVQAPQPRPSLAARNSSHHPADRIVWQGWLWWLKSKRGVRQWKDCWAVLRPRNLILYRDESEYQVQFLVELSGILNVVDVDPMSRSKTHCLQIVTEEKSFRFCAHDEDVLVRCLGAFKSLLAKRKDLEAKAVAAMTSET